MTKEKQERKALKVAQAGEAAAQAARDAEKEKEEQAVKVSMLVIILYSCALHPSTFHNTDVF